ncbi:MAG: hypothetical protein B7Y41_00955 [Hydrogenophilales bacterium 28-61-23]|nr:MAG: hypothetical protein B7Y41_00955 [Hydrogenophilales bacterium 28-61-23]
MPLLHPSGGLVYHLRARRWRRTLWRPFHALVERWLREWQPNTTRLVLIGPSAGYALNADFLARFERIDVLEPDPLARLLLRRRFPRQRFQFADSAWLAGTHGFEMLIRRYPDAAFLFCNLLGQHLVGAAPDRERRNWLRGLDAALRGRAWASWHDLASSARRPDRFPPLARPAAEALDQVIAQFWRGGELEIHDHDCASIRPDLPRQYAIWQLGPNRYHLIEWIAVSGLG